MTKGTEKNDKEATVQFLAPDAEIPVMASRAHYTKWTNIREQLAANPNVWAIILEANEGDPGYSSVHGKKTALARKFPEIQAEIRTENGVRRLYARHLA